MLEAGREGMEARKEESSVAARVAPWDDARARAGFFFSSELLQPDSPKS